MSKDKDNAQGGERLGLELNPEPLYVTQSDSDRSSMAHLRGPAGKIANLVKHANPGFVLGLDGGYGTGKTTFLHLLEEQLQQEEHLTVKFNAWQSDFDAEPLPAIVKSFKNVTSPKNMKTEVWKRIKNSIEKFKELHTWLHFGKMTVAIATRRDMQEVNNTIEGLSKREENIITSFTKLHDEYETELNKVNILVKELTACLAESGEKKKVVLMIDDLDRCKPDYAIAVLEKAKHVFGAGDVFVVVALNRDALAASIERSYGFPDGEEYLRRIFHNSMSIENLMRMDERTFQSIDERYGLSRYFNERIEAFRKMKVIESNDHYFTMTMHIIFGLFEKFNMSYRDVEQLVSVFLSALRQVPYDNVTWEYLTMLFSFIKVMKPALYRKATRVLRQEPPDCSRFPLAEIVSLFAKADVENNSIFPDDLKSLGTSTDKRQGQIFNMLTILIEFCIHFGYNNNREDLLTIINQYWSEPNWVNKRSPESIQSVRALIDQLELISTDLVDEPYKHEENDRH